MLSISLSDFPIPSWSNLYPRALITKSNSAPLSASVFLVLVKNSVTRCLIDVLSSALLLPSAAAFNPSAVDLSGGTDPLPRASLAFLSAFSLTVFSLASLACISARVSLPNGLGFPPAVLAASGDSRFFGTFCGSGSARNCCCGLVSHI